MKTFIEDYLRDPSDAIAQARSCSDTWSGSIDEDMIYAQIASPEFRLYEAMLFCPSAEEDPSVFSFASL